MADTRVQTALDDLLAGKAAVDDSRTKLADYLDSGPRLDGYGQEVIGSLKRSFDYAVQSLNTADAMFQLLLGHIGDKA